MSLLSRIQQFFTPKAQSPENPNISLSQWYNELTGMGSDISTLPAVTENTARSVSALYRCVSLLSGAVAILPLKVIHRPKNGISRVADEHKLAPLLNFAPVPGLSMSAYTWKSLIMTSRIFGGNFYARILYDGAARVVGLRYYHYYHVRVVPLLEPPYTRHYIFTEPNGTMSDPIPDDEVIHIMGESHNGLIGESLVFSHAKMAIQQHLFLQEQTRNVHNNAVKASGVVKLPQGINVAQKKRYEDFFKLAYAGSANTGNLLWLDAGAEFTQLTPSLSLVDLNTIEFMRYGVSDICRFCGVPSHLANEQSQTSSFGTGLEQIGRSFLLYTLEPHLCAIEEELRIKLFGNGDYFPQFDRAPLFAADSKTEAEVESIRLNNGSRLINEVRREDNLPPVEFGDVPLVNGTATPLSVAANKTDTKPASGLSPEDPATDTPPPDAPKPPRKRASPKPP